MRYNMTKSNTTQGSAPTTQKAKTSKFLVAVHPNRNGKDHDGTYTVKAVSNKNVVGTVKRTFSTLKSGRQSKNHTGFSFSPKSGSGLKQVEASRMVEIKTELTAQLQGQSRAN